jgi:hypothetical protein
MDLCWRASHLGRNAHPWRNVTNQKPGAIKGSRSADVPDDMSRDTASPVFWIFRQFPAGCDSSPTLTFATGLAVASHADLAAPPVPCR